MTEVHLINVHQPTQHLCAPPLCSSLRMSPSISRASTLCLKLWLDNAHTPAHASTRLRGPRSPPRLRHSSHRDPMPLLSTPSWTKMACSRCVSQTSDWANLLSKRTLSTRTRTPWIPRVHAYTGASHPQTRNGRGVLLSPSPPLLVLLRYVAVIPDIWPSLTTLPCSRSRPYTIASPPRCPARAAPPTL